MTKGFIINDLSNQKSPATGDTLRQQPATLTNLGTGVSVGTPTSFSPSNSPCLAEPMA
jgi:hypothetical protein